MSDPNDNAPADAEATAPAYVTKDDLAAVVNAAITGHLKRVKWEDILSPIVARSLPKAPPAEAQPTADPKAVDPKLKMLEERLAEMQRRSDDAERRARETELRAARDATRAAAKELIEARGIKGFKAAALISHLEATGQLAYGEDGTPTLKVRRARIKGESAQDLTHDDLRAGIDDWSKTDEAAEFLPAPVATKPAPKPGAAPPPPPPGTAPRPASINSAIDAAVALLEAGAPPNR